MKKWHFIILLGLLCSIGLVYFFRHKDDSTTSSTVAPQQKTTSSTTKRNISDISLSTEHKRTSIAEENESNKKLFGEPSIAPPIPKYFPKYKEPQMGWATAQIVSEQQRYEPKNLHGRFSKMEVTPSEKLDVTISWPKSIPGTSVALEVADGGRLGSGDISQLKRVDASGSISFTYTANSTPGTCQVVLRSGFDEQVFDFYVVANKKQEM